MWIRFANPWIHFDLICQFSKDPICGFVSFGSVQKIRFMDSFHPRVLKRFVSWICFMTQFSKDLMNPTNPHQSLVQ